MIQSLGRTTLLVRDYDAALKFYCGTLGFDIIFNQTAANGQRYVHIGLPTQAGDPPVGLWLHKPSSAEERDLIGRQAGEHPFLVLYTDDCAGTAEELAASGIRFTEAIQRQGDSSFAQFEDLYGNRLVLVELHE